MHPNVHSTIIYNSLGMEAIYVSTNRSMDKEDVVYIWDSQVALVVRNHPAMQETQEVQVQSLGQEDPLEEGMATHSSIRAWKILWTEEPGGYSPQGHRESDTTEVT